MNAKVESFSGIFQSIFTRSWKEKTFSDFFKLLTSHKLFKRSFSTLLRPQNKKQKSFLSLNFFTFYFFIEGFVTVKSKRVKTCIKIEKLQVMTWQKTLETFQGKRVKRS